MTETVYLLHFQTPYKHARHYLGWTKNDLQLRLNHHANGTGAGLTRAASEAGIPWVTARIWENATHDFERKLHSRNENPSLCPICNPDGWSRLANLETHQPQDTTQEIPF